MRAAALFKREDSINCRSCGGVESAPDAASMHGLCGDCWTRYTKYCRFGDHIENENTANAWIARQLFLSAKRMQKYGVTGRCEAITEGALVEYLLQRRPHSGFQCCRPATMMRDGRRVCTSHSTKIAVTVMFVENPGRLDAYGEFRRIITELCKTDAGFLKATKDAIEGFGPTGTDGAVGTPLAPEGGK